MSPAAPLGKHLGGEPATYRCCRMPEGPSCAEDRANCLTPVEKETTEGRIQLDIGLGYGSNVPAVQHQLLYTHYQQGWRVDVLDRMVQDDAVVAMVDEFAAKCVGKRSMGPGRVAATWSAVRVQAISAGSPPEKK